MSDTPTPRVGEQIVYLLDDTMNEVEAVPAEFARQLERELAGAHERCTELEADLADQVKQHGDTIRDYRCLAELLDGHDATECRANLVRLKADLSAERALADRLAKGCDALLTGYNTSSWDSPMEKGDVDECEQALAAWKEARHE